MLSRRQLLGSGFLTAFSGALGGWARWRRSAPAPLEPSARGPGTAPTGGLPERAVLFAVLFDERFEDAERFASVARRHGLAVRGVRADITELWYRELEPLWQRSPRPVAGLTPYAALFCLERLAWTHGMRVVLHGTHTGLASGAVQHVLKAPWRAAPASPGIPGSNETGWPEALAAQLARQASERGWNALPPAVCSAEARFRTAGCVPAAGIEPPLHSWVIARAVCELERT